MQNGLSEWHVGVFCGNMSQIMSGESGLYNCTVWLYILVQYSKVLSQNTEQDRLFILLTYRHLPRSSQGFCVAPPSHLLLVLAPWSLTREMADD